MSPEKARLLKHAAWVGGGALLSVLLQYLAFPPLDLGPLILIAFVPWLLALDGMGYARAFLLSCAVGWVFCFGALFWISNVTLAGLVMASFGLCGFFGASGLGFAALRRTHRLPCALAAPLIFVTIDLLRSFLLSGFPWLYAGHALYRARILIQIADLVGAYGVTALALAVNGALMDIYLAARGGQTRRTAVFASAGVAFLVLASLVYGAVRMRPGEETGPEVLLVQGNIPQSVKDSGDSLQLQDVWDRHIRLTLEGVRDSTDLVIWPETMVPRSITADTEMLGGLLELSEDLGLPLLVGTIRVDPVPGEGLGSYNSAMLVLPGGTLAGHYDKIHRVPGGEYIPFRSWFPALGRLLKSMFGYLPDVPQGNTLRPLEIVDRAGKAWRFGVLVCYECIFPELARPQVRDGARFLVNVTNEGWFGTIGEQEQIQAIACFRAVESRVTVIRAANTGISALVGPDGAIYKVLERDGRQLEIEGVLAGRVRIDGRPTLYRAVGDAFAWLCLLATVGLLLFGEIRSRRKTP